MSKTKQIAPGGKALTAPSNRSAVEKAAAVLALLDEKTLNALAGKVAEKHRDKLLSTARSMRSVPQPELRQIAQEFAQRLSVERNAVRGSEQVAKRLTATLFEDEAMAEAAALAEEPAEVEEIVDDSPFWDRIGKMPLKKLIAYFEDKSASVLGIALQQLPSDTASELAGELDGNLVREAILMMATTGKPNPLAIEAVESMIESALMAKSVDGEEGGEEEGNPNADVVADILNRMTNKRRENVLEALKDTLEDDEMGEIASKVLSFEALEYRLPRNGVPVIFREVAEKDLLVALKFALSQNNPVAEYLLGNISQRLATTYREKMETMSDIDDETGEKAQSVVICKLLLIVEQGRVELLEPKSDEDADPEGETES